MLGRVNRGERAVSPMLGDRIFVGAGAKIIGRIHLGDGCAVGANAVVTKDVPENGVVGGIPAKLISEAGSEGYINRLVPDRSEEHTSELQSLMRISYAVF